MKNSLVLCFCDSLIHSFTLGRRRLFIEFMFIHQLTTLESITIESSIFKFIPDQISIESKRDKLKPSPSPSS
jgi:hypothetical protein